MKKYNMVLSLLFALVAVGCFPTSNDSEDDTKSSKVESSATDTSSSSAKKTSSSSKDSLSSEEITSSSSATMSKTIDIDGVWHTTDAGGGELIFAFVNESEFVLSTKEPIEDGEPAIEIARILGTYSVKGDSLTISYDQCFVIDATSLALTGALEYSENPCSELTGDQTTFTSLVEKTAKVLKIIEEDDTTILKPLLDFQFSELVMVTEVSPSSSSYEGDAYKLVDTESGQETVINFTSDSTLKVFVNYDFNESGSYLPYLMFGGSYAWESELLVGEYTECASSDQKGGLMEISCVDLLGAESQEFTQEIILQGDTLVESSPSGTNFYVKMK